MSLLLATVGAIAIRKGMLDKSEFWGGVLGGLGVVCVIASIALMGGELLRSVEP